MSFKLHEEYGGSSRYEKHLGLPFAILGLLIFLICQSAHIPCDRQICLLLFKIEQVVELGQTEHHEQMIYTNA